MSGAIRLDDITAVDIAEARARLPRVFGRRWQERTARAVVTIGIVTYLGYLHWLFDFARIFSGLDRLWVVLGLMVDWSQFASWDHAEILTSLVETLAMDSWALAT
jgi:ABC-type phosphate/phosphonate transport system permease subunit